MANRMVARGKSKGYVIDASGETNNPIYFDTKNLGPTEDVKDTPESTNTSAAPTVVGGNTHYQIGHCFLEKPTDAEKKTLSAGLSDQPQGIKKKGAGMMFETTALATDGHDQGQYYGSVKWGYKVGGTRAAPKVRDADIFDIKEASKGTPTPNFTEAAKLWNVGKTRGTLEVNPSSPQNRRTAYVQYVSGSGDARLAKGVKLRLVKVIKGTTEGMIEAEILDAAGNGSGNVVNIYVADVKDVGDGSANKPLPIPVARPANKP
jgi:hypothetical protein